MKKYSALIAGVISIGLLATVAQAQPYKKKKFAEKHPRRAQVLNRVNNEKNKNNAAAANGEITQQQANRLDHQDQMIRAEEQADARANGGHITRAEQRDLNRQENRINHERSAMEKRDALKNTSSTGTAPASNSTVPASATGSSGQ